jgi:4-alpha-glucanotransferase
MNSAPRQSGILLHPTSLPGPHGSGDLGTAAFHFVDWLVAGGQSLWQLLPLTGLGPGNSPYSSPSAFAGNELLIDLVQLQDAGWLTPADLAEAPAFPEQRIDYAAVRPFRMDQLRRAAARFFASGKTPSTRHSRLLRRFPRLARRLRAVHGAGYRPWR